MDQKPDHGPVGASDAHRDDGEDVFAAPASEEISGVDTFPGRAVIKSTFTAFKQPLGLRYQRRPWQAPGSAIDAAMHKVLSVQYEEAFVFFGEEETIMTAGERGAGIRSQFSIGELEE